MRMDISKRPRLVDFKPHLGSDFAVNTLDQEADPQLWKLENIEELPQSPLESLANEDCFILEFSVPAGSEQEFYRFEAPDGAHHNMVAIPVMGIGGGAAMQVVIN